MVTIVVALLAGLVFGTGLVISGMTQPTKVLGFLDVFGTWDPTLAFVMGGAIAVALPGFMLAGRRPAPFLAGAFQWPTKKDIDAPLVGGSVLFGLGWGLVGLCPGPAIANLSTFSAQATAFVIAMAIGIAGLDYWQRRGTAAAGGARA